MLDRDYAVFMDKQQAVNLGVMRRFEDTDLDFAFPTQTLHLDSVPESMGEAMTQLARVEAKARPPRESRPS